MNDLGQVFVLDDNADFRALYLQALTMQGYRAEAFEDGVKALDRLRFAESLPKVILLDFVMQKMSGEDFIRQLRQDQSLRGIKVILVSAWTDLPAKAREIGADGFLHKPFDLDKLYGAIETV